MAEELEWIDVRQCDSCLSHFTEAGPDGILVHALAEHPDGELARRVRSILAEPAPTVESLERMLEGSPDV